MYISVNQTCYCYQINLLVCILVFYTNKGIYFTTYSTSFYLSFLY